MTISHEYWTSIVQLDEYTFSAGSRRYDVYLKYYEGFRNQIAYEHIKRK